MQEIEGLLFPDADTHFADLCGRKNVPVRSYQSDRIEFAVAHCKLHEVCIEVGSHVGLHTVLLAAAFDKVYAFEAHPDNYECLLRNTADLPNVECFNYAICAKAKGVTQVDDVTDGNSGNLQIGGNGPMVNMRSIDSLNLPAPDFIKLDIQGAEFLALQGARNAIIAGSPLIQFEEERPGKLRRPISKTGRAGVWLHKLGGDPVRRMGSDHFYAFDDGAWVYSKYRKLHDYHWQKYKSGKLKAIVDATADYIAKQNHSSIIDIGCGDGVWTGIVNTRSSELFEHRPCFGIDRDRTALKWARRHGVPCELGSAHKLGEFGFAAAMCIDVLEHIPHPEQVVAEFARRGTPDVYVMNPTPNNSNWHISEMQHDEMAEMFRTFGYRVEHRVDFKVTSSNHKSFFHFKLSEIDK